MDRNYGKLTVYFENPFWVGVFERIENGKLSVCKVTFGSEPKDYEVCEYVLKNYYQLKFSPAVDVVVKKQATNPKRVQREASCHYRYWNKIATGAEVTAGTEQAGA